MVVGKNKSKTIMLYNDGPTEICIHYSVIIQMCLEKKKISLIFIQRHFLDKNFTYKQDTVCIICIHWLISYLGYAKKPMKLHLIEQK